LPGPEIDWCSLELPDENAFEVARIFFSAPEHFASRPEKAIVVNYYGSLAYELPTYRFTGFAAGLERKFTLLPLNSVICPWLA
jgi:hypothetical protein